MKTIHTCLLVTLLMLALPLSVAADDSAPPMESANYVMTSSTLEEDHGGPAESETFTLQVAVVGQTVAQETSAGNEHLLCAGFICFPLSDQHHIFLPLVLRQ